MFRSFEGDSQLIYKNFGQKRIVDFGNRNTLCRLTTIHQVPYDGTLLWGS